jgi:hypothetical protein
MADDWKVSRLPRKAFFCGIGEESISQDRLPSAQRFAAILIHTIRELAPLGSGSMPVLGCDGPASTPDNPSTMIIARTAANVTVIPVGRTEPVLPERSPPSGTTFR